jgi:hypothetical protein
MTDVSTHQGAFMIAAREMHNTQHRFSSSSRLHTLPLFLLALALLAQACAPKLYARLSFNQPAELPVAEGMVAFTTGESFEINEIIKKEGKTPEKVLLTRILGTYVLTAEGFKHLWLLRPEGRDQATFSPIEVPDTPTIQSPKFQQSTKHHCVEFEVSKGGTPTKWFVHASGSLSKQCSDLAKE